jgi:hypothetical protein
LPWYLFYTGDTGDGADPYAAIAGQLVAEVDQQGACGWVVDLRGNTGGDLWAMLAGAGPILGEGEVGAFVYVDGRREVWGSRAGQALLDGRVMAQGLAYHLARPQPPVAVLTDSSTASSGEAMAIAFRGRPKTRSFGEPTAGLPTKNDLKVMSDGAWLLLTVARTADRTGQIYDGRIVPDQAVGAIRWCRRRSPGCMTNPTVPGDGLRSAALLRQRGRWRRPGRQVPLAAGERPARAGVARRRSPRRRFRLHAQDGSRRARPHRTRPAHQSSHLVRGPHADRRTPHHG